MPALHTDVYPVETLFSLAAELDRNARGALAHVLERLASGEHDAEAAAAALLEALISAMDNCQAIKAGSYALMRDTVAGGGP